MTFNAKEIENITILAKEVEGLEALLDFEWDGYFDRKAIAERYGFSIPVFEGSTDAAFKATWQRLVAACKGDEALAREVTGVDPSYLEYTFKLI